MRVIRHEDPTGDASRVLFAEYMDLVRERLGDDFVPTEQIFATEDDFDGADDETGGDQGQQTLGSTPLRHGPSP